MELSENVSDIRHTDDFRIPKLIITGQSVSNWIFLIFDRYEEYKSCTVI